MAITLVDRIAHGGAPAAANRISVHGARRSARSRRVTVTVAGEIDASNVRDFADGTCRLAVGCAHLTLDLTGVGFMALDGITALHAIRAQLMRADSVWEVIPSVAVSRVLHLCDPAGLIRTRSTAADRIAV